MYESVHRIPRLWNRLRFSLLTLLFLVLLAGSACAVWMKREAWVVQHTFRSDDYGLYEMALSPDGRKLVLPSSVGKLEEQKAGPVHIYDFEHGTDRQIPDTRIEFAPDSRSIVSLGDDFKARIWDAETLNCVATLSSLPNRIESASYSPNSEYIVTCASDYDHQKICLWDSTSGALHATLSGRKLLRFSPDGRLVVTTDQATTNVFDVRTGQLRFKIDDGPPENIKNNDRGPRREISPQEEAGWTYMGMGPISPQEYGMFFSGDSQLLAIADRDRTHVIDHLGNAHEIGTNSDRIRIFNTQTGVPTAVFDVKSAWLTSDCFSPNCFSPDGHWIAASLDTRDGGTFRRTAQFWNILDHSTQRFARVPEYWSGNGKFLKDGRFEIAGIVRDLRLSTESPEEELALQSGEQVAFSERESPWALTFLGNKAWVWENGKRLRTLENFATTPNCNLHFSKSGQRFVCEGEDYCSAMVWRTDSGACQRLNVPRGNQETCGFVSYTSPDERYIVATWGAGGEVHIFFRRHPEGFAGIVAIPEFWIGIVSVLGIIFQVARALRRQPAFHATPAPLHSSSTVAN